MNKLSNLIHPAFIAGSLVTALFFSACEDVRTEEYPSGKIRIQSTYVKDKKEVADDLRAAKKYSEEFGQEISEMMLHKLLYFDNLLYDT